MAGVRSNFTRTPINVSGDIENPILVFDQTANAAQAYALAATEKMSGVDFANYSDNLAKIEIVLEDTNAVQKTETVTVLPNGVKSYNFKGVFIVSVSAVAAEEPTVTGLASALTAVDTGTGGIVGKGMIDVSFIET